MFIPMRVILPKNKQKFFINSILENIPINEAAKLCNLSERTIRDWYRGKFSMDLNSINILCRKTGIPLPKEAEIKEDYWYTGLGSSIGAMTCLKKYGRVGGDPDYRIKKWYEWWEADGKHRPRENSIFARKSFQKPQYSEDVAEFVGIILGDGGISQNQIKITFNAKDEKDYLQFIAGLVKRLFNVPFGIHNIYHGGRHSATDIVISRVGLTEFCIEQLGLKKGNKVRQQVDVPKWIRGNNFYLAACVRGLVDTDGSIFAHSYKVKGKLYYYKKLAFSNRSKPLLTTVYQFFKDCGFSPRFTSDGKDVRLDSKNDIRSYFNVIGSHNPRHLNKYFS